MRRPHLRRGAAFQPENTGPALGTDVAHLAGVRWRVVAVALAIGVGMLSLILTARVAPQRVVVPVVQVQHRAPPQRVVLVFIDSLSHAVATNRRIMPALSALAEQGASFEVQPCRDQLTYLCVRAALTGYDDSSLLAVADNFRPGREGPPDTLLSAVASIGGGVGVIGTSDFVYGALVFAMIATYIAARRRLTYSLFAGALLLNQHLHSERTQLAAIEFILAELAIVLAALPKLGLSAFAQRGTAALSIAVALYLMLWPSVGFHLAGIDFRYMFQWIPEGQYEQYWPVIAAGLVFKLSLPLTLVLFISRGRLRDAGVSRMVSIALATKVTLVALMLTAYAAVHSMGSQEALAILAEQVLLLFILCTCLFLLPWPVHQRKAVFGPDSTAGTQPVR